MNNDNCNNGNSSEVTANSMSANNTTGAAIVVVPEGTSIPLPNNQVLNEFEANNKNTRFTVPASGGYAITYAVSLTSPLKLSTRVTRNGEAVPVTIVSPATSSSYYTISIVTQLEAGDKLSLELYGGHAVAVLNEGVGAVLTITQLF